MQGCWPITHSPPQNKLEDWLLTMKEKFHPQRGPRGCHSTHSCHSPLAIPHGSKDVGCDWDPLSPGSILIAYSSRPYQLSHFITIILWKKLLNRRKKFNLNRGTTCPSLIGQVYVVDVSRSGPTNKERPTTLRFKLRSLSRFILWTYAE